MHIYCVILYDKYNVYYHVCILFYFYTLHYFVYIHCILHNIILPYITHSSTNGHNSDPHPSPLFTGILWEVLALEQTREAGRLSKDQPDLWIPSAQRGQNYDEYARSILYCYSVY